MNSLLIIDDDERLAHMVGGYLRQAGFFVQHAFTGEAGLSIIRSHHPPQLVILDLMLPDQDGLDVCQQIRKLSGQLSATPILMLTARGGPLDRINGLEIGADDYLSKPFDPRELLARIKAILRRFSNQQPNNPPAAVRDVLQFGSLRIDRDSRTVLLNESLRELTGYQFDLLLALAERAGRVMSRESIMEVVRGRELEAFDRSIDVHIGRIRSAIEHDVKTPRRILTVRGVGYVFAKQQD
jgi:DNA-binding response OmpR family regulator